MPNNVNKTELLCRTIVIDTLVLRFLFVEQLDQFEVCLPYSRLLTGIPILVVFCNLRGNSNKTSLAINNYWQRKIGLINRTDSCNWAETRHYLKYSLPKCRYVKSWYWVSTCNYLMWMVMATIGPGLAWDSGVGFIGFIAQV